MTKEDIIKLSKNNPGIKVNPQGRPYVSNPVLFKEIVESKKAGKLSTAAMEMLMVLCEHIATTQTYERYEDKEDCVSTAFLDCISYWESFDETKGSNPFAYFTSIATNGLRKGWRQLGYRKDVPRSLFTSLDNNIHTL